MHGAVYGVLLLAVIAVAALVINPVVALVVLGLLVVPAAVLVLGKGLHKAQVGRGPGPSGVPTTGDAGYQPVREP